VERFQQVVELCIGLDDVHAPLPPPQQFARTLRRTALELLYKWHNKYGAAHKQIGLAYRFLEYVPFL
jgi:hypothetical protein